MRTTDPLHGVTLKALLEALVERHGWEELARRVPVRCFQNEPSVNSSLKFLRKTPWARTEVEAIYVREAAALEKKKLRNHRRAARRAFASLPVEREDTLALVWPADAVVPTVEPPSGYRLTLGVDLPALDKVQDSIGFAVTADILDGLLGELVPDAMAFLHGEKGPVAVVCALQRPDDWVELSWVAVDPSHRGRGLGRAVCAALLAQLLAAGTTRIVLSTPDERVQALRIYLELGFQPVERPEKAERWAAVHSALQGEMATAPS